MNTNIIKKPPIGIEDFKELIENFYFVDKSDFIASILDNYSKISLITRPRRFGKTLMLSMLNYFFTIDNAENNRALFSDLKISQLDKNYMDHQGKSPVIFISLKNITGDNFNDFIESISFDISKLYRMFPYILDSPIIDEYDKDYFKKLCARKGTIKELERSLENLTHILSIYHQKKAVVLIDEYDSPINDAWDKKYYDKCIGFMKIFLGSCFKSNIDLDFAVITGITRVSKESIFSGVNNFSVFSVFDNAFNDVFGFTEEEVKHFLDYYNICDKIGEVKEWYDGYRFCDKDIYNPFSIVNYIRNKYLYNSEPTGYWVNTSGNIIINYILQSTDIFLKEDIEKLMKHDSIDKIINENLIYSEITTNINALFLILISSGYLKILNKIRNGNRWLCTLTIPNKEIYEIFRDEIYERLSDKSKLNLNIILNSLISGNEVAFNEAFSNFLILSVSFFDTAENLQENFYHGLFLGFISIIGEDYIIESNKESGYGRFDICCIPKNGNNPGIILEFKVSKSKESLDKDATQALSQITDLKYATIFAKYSSKYPVNNIWQYGIAFYKRDFVIKKKDA